MEPRSLLALVCVESEPRSGDAPGAGLGVPFGNASPCGLGVEVRVESGFVPAVELDVGLGVGLGAGFDAGVDEGLDGAAGVPARVSPSPGVSLVEFAPLDSPAFVSPEVPLAPGSTFAGDLLPSFTPSAPAGRPAFSPLPSPRCSAADLPESAVVVPGFAASGFVVSGFEASGFIASGFEGTVEEGDPCGDDGEDPFGVAAFSPPGEGLCDDVGELPGLGSEAPDDVEGFVSAPPPPDFCPSAPRSFTEGSPAVEPADFGSFDVVCGAFGSASFCPAGDCPPALVADVDPPAPGSPALGWPPFGSLVVFAPDDSPDAFSLDVEEPDVGVLVGGLPAGCPPLAGSPAFGGDVGDSDFPLGPADSGREPPFAPSRPTDSFDPGDLSDDGFAADRSPVDAPSFDEDDEDEGAEPGEGEPGEGELGEGELGDEKLVGAEFAGEELGCEGLGCAELPGAVSAEGVWRTSSAASFIASASRCTSCFAGEPESGVLRVDVSPAAGVVLSAPLFDRVGSALPASRRASPV